MGINLYDVCFTINREFTNDDGTINRKRLSTMSNPSQRKIDKIVVGIKRLRAIFYD